MNAKQTGRGIPIGRTAWAMAAAMVLGLGAPSVGAGAAAGALFAPNRFAGEAAGYGEAATQAAGTARETGAPDETADGPFGSPSGDAWASTRQYPGQPY